MPRGPSPSAIDLTDDQIRWFRARRGHLAGPGAPDAVAAARALIGAQAQQLNPALLALSLRTETRPTATGLAHDLLEKRRLVRIWGQRGTLHLYDAATDWARVIAARQRWSVDSRGGPLPDDRTLDKAMAVIERAGEPVGRTELLGIAPARYVKALAERAAMAGLDPERLAAARLLQSLARRGDVCVAGKRGAEQLYAARSAWFSDLAWPAAPAPDDAAVDLARRYLATYGPATAQDVAHFFGASVAAARSWLAALSGELVTVHCDGRKPMTALARDADDLSQQPPRGRIEWPLRLLPLYDSMLMGHADKTWIAREQADQKAIWRKAAYVAAVVIDRGRAVATWSQATRARRLVVEVQPLSRWSARVHVAAVRQEAHAVAEHLGMKEAEVIA